MDQTSAGMCRVVSPWCFEGAEQKMNMSGSKRKVCTDWETLAYQFIADRSVGGRRASVRMPLQACDRQKWMTLLLSFLPGWVCCCSSPSPAVSGLEQDCHTALPALHVYDLMYGPLPALTSWLPSAQESLTLPTLSAQQLLVLAKPSGPGALSLKLTPSFSLSHGQGPQVCFSVLFSVWL